MEGFMRNTIIKGAIVGGIIVFIWGFFSWMVLPWHNSTMSSFKNESAVAKVIKENATGDGMYMMPYCSPNQTTDEKEAAMQRMQTGPFMFASIKPMGSGMMSAGHFVKSLIIQVISAGIITWLVTRTRGLNYTQRVGYIAMIAFFAGFVVNMPAWNWMGFSTRYVVVGILDLVIGWTIAGFAIAKIAK